MRAKTDHFIMRNSLLIKKRYCHIRDSNVFLTKLNALFLYHIIKEIIRLFVSLKHIGIIVV